MTAHDQRYPFYLFNIIFHCIITFHDRGEDVPYLDLLMSLLILLGYHCWIKCGERVMHAHALGKYHNPLFLWMYSLFTNSLFNKILVP